MRPITSWGTENEKAPMTDLSAPGLTIHLSTRLRPMQISNPLFEISPEIHSVFGVEGYAKGGAAVVAGEGGGGVKSI
jgi:hypothetical protein